MSDEGYSTSFSYLLLAGTSTYCLKQYQCDMCSWRLACASFSLILLNAILGALYWGNDSGKEVVEKAYELTSFMRSIFALPFIVTQVWLEYGYECEIAGFYSIICLIPFHLYLGNKTKQPVIDIVVAVNSTALGIVSFIYLHSLHISARNFDFDESSVVDMQNYGMICFTYYSLMCLLKRRNC
ncbi:hypothetical protein RN001_007125 [Aquatica leii]|uniref:Uncharacterized protein n=1 Tax=Aquatica leii TaxID=1421715 RepID=A0AAN7P8A4_9COLE|nr:hypothetical protein RN001_007125 [Aquatica leii]